MKKSEKHISLLQKRLSLVDKISISDAVELLNISESSVRRIFARMEKDNLAMRVHGGLVKSIQHDEQPNGYSYSAVQSVNLAQKTKIALEVAKRIINKNSVYLDSGSTIYRVSLALANLIENNPNSNLKVFTNSLKNLEILQGLCSIRISGGDYRVERRDLCGFIAENSISMINFDTCVIGADGVDFAAGLTTTDFETANLCMRALKNSKTKILAVDSSKFNKTALVTYAKLSDFTTIITDSGISPETVKLLESYNLEVVIVN